MLAALGSIIWRSVLWWPLGAVVLALVLVVLGGLWSLPWGIPVLLWFGLWTEAGLVAGLWALFWVVWNRTGFRRLLAGFGAL